MIYRFLTDAKDQGCRLDLCLCQRSDLSRTTVRKIIDLGGVHVDGRRIRKCGTLMQKGQQVELHQDKQPPTPFRLQKKHILFQDKHIIVLNKPAGVETQPTPARYKGTLHEALQFFLKEQGVTKPSTGMHQRLDRDTSGLLLFTLHPMAHKEVAKQMQKRGIQRQYLALVTGVPQPAAATIRSNLARRRCDNQMVSVDKGGKEAITHYQVEKTFLTDGESYSLIFLTLETGRSHQIRVHLAEKGHPLLGDLLYEGAMEHHGKSYCRQCLHSCHLAFKHPVSGEKMEFTLPLPEDMQP